MKSIENPEDSSAMIAVALRDVSVTLLELMNRYWQSYIEQASNAGVTPINHPDLLPVMFKVWAGSDFVAENCIKYPEMLDELLHGGDLLIDYGGNEYRQQLLKATQHVSNDDELGEALRIQRRREMVRIAWRDLAGWAGLEETLADLSMLASASLEISLQILQRWQSRETGIPYGADSRQAQSMVVLGMGKLGAYELNFSSDIDLIFAYPEEGETRSKLCPVSNEEYFISLGRRLINVINAQTEQGFVFRVDMRLRPYGESGPLAMSFAAIEEYYQLQGREWERYAMIKACPVAGDLKQGQYLLEQLRPFVYRRYLDYGTFESLREMKVMIMREVERKGVHDNIKLGPGGIREIEFIGQAFQLIRGGREPELQQRGILVVLDRLAASGHIPQYVRDDLRDAYLFLRRVENHIQAYADQQAHDLPSDELACSRLAFSLGFADWRGFIKVLDRHRRMVSSHFDQVFAAPQINGNNLESSASNKLSVLWEGKCTEQEAVQILAATGFDQPLEIYHRFIQLRESHACRTLSSQGKARLARLIPLLTAAAVETEAPGTALTRVLGLLDAIVRRSAYIALLVENPMALSQLVKLCAASPWITGLLTDLPVLLDELLDPRTLYKPLDRAGLEQELRQLLSTIPAQDLEQQMDRLRNFKQANVLRVAAADVMGALPLMVVSDHLTEIAEVIVVKVLELAMAHVAARKFKKNSDSGFAIIAYGKLGGIELGYGSDLDLVFLHGRDGHQGDEDGVFYARVGQRIIHILNAHTPVGVLYEVDVRLRPSGASGLLVSSIESFAGYQRDEAWTWEHQALVRARVIAGDAAIERQFDKIRREVLSRQRDPDQLCREVSEMREKMRSELSAGGSGSFDIKQDPGGIADIEFIVQYGVLRWAHQYPSMLRWTDNIRLLASFAELGLMPEADVMQLGDAYRAYRALVHRLTLQERPAVVSGDQLTDYRSAVSEVWNGLMMAE